MKRKVTVITENEYEIEIDDELLTEESLNEFSSTIFKVDDIDELFETSAYQIDYCNGECFIEGLGQAREYYNKGKDVKVRYKLIHEEFSVNVHK